MEECREAKGKEVRKEGRRCVTREKRSEGGDEGWKEEKCWAGRPNNGAAHLMVNLNGG